MSRFTDNKCYSGAPEQRDVLLKAFLPHRELSDCHERLEVRVKMIPHQLNMVKWRPPHVSLVLLNLVALATLSVFLFLLPFNLNWSAKK